MWPPTKIKTWISGKYENPINGLLDLKTGNHFSIAGMSLEIIIVIIIINSLNNFLKEDTTQ